ncbi:MULTISPECIES: Fic family protein [Cysteiniphilum]|uniref:Cell filamentation protein Fic n=1 Tax=Cysteiniphilum litorale TaxID=2056700 RepID=A0A8J2Z2C6_9GAMM|nr:MULTISPECIES: Fic family protein [Cysteiniphilum]GGF90193.1 cell filamentation protein Fic [Cysteiniphilum litorale]
MSYKPPFTITTEILNLVVEISQAVGRLSAEFEQEKLLRLRKVNRMRTVQGSLAIEGNTLSQEQITAILDGKRVIAPPKEVLEAQNAIATYELIDTWQPANNNDLLTAHRLLMNGLIEEAGRYRSQGVGVMSGDQVVHMAPQADRVPKLMHELLDWLSTTDLHPLIASCIFHYEFEFIHPFSDGNGRMGRLWQTLILSQWQPVFINIPVESLVHQHQQAYYLAIRSSTAKTDCSPFIEFMLQMILDAIEESTSLPIKNEGLNEGLNKGLSEGLKLSILDQSILELMKTDPTITNALLAEQTGKALSTIERRIKKLKEHNLLKRVGAKKTGHWEVCL